ncbi:hypothetical protein Ddye_000271 [Dipteronia dyeriana]|uniref:Uncharacterized protein n=1 Tax=Dipteronia dyeriana TaxID=168575 RepID=A0AAD9XM19_9ROSI|nr:hypothetical protein Ddye_000271 [Dipteronia dyeriana]
MKSKSVTLGNGSGSRFDGLNEYVEVMIVEEESRVLNKVQKVMVPPIENEDLDSASVLRQSHKEITNFVANSSESPAIYEKCVNKPVMQNDNSFDMVSSKLAEAMVMFSE